MVPHGSLCTTEPSPPQKLIMDKLVNDAAKFGQTATSMVNKSAGELAQYTKGALTMYA